jgi:hypothetical protein
MHTEPLTPLIGLRKIADALSEGGQSLSVTEGLLTIHSESRRTSNAAKRVTRPVITSRPAAFKMFWSLVQRDE